MALHVSRAMSMTADCTLPSTGTSVNDCPPSSSRPTPNSVAVTFWRSKASGIPSPLEIDSVAETVGVYPLSGAEQRPRSNHYQPASPARRASRRRQDAEDPVAQHREQHVHVVEIE